MKAKKSLPVEYVIVSILANLSEDIKTLPTEKSLLHKTFYNLREKSYSLFKGLVFETTYYPYSEYIEQAFDNIEMSGLISKANPVMETFTLNREAIRRFYDGEIKDFLSKKDVKEIVSIADSFPSLLTS